MHPALDTSDRAPAHLPGTASAQPLLAAGLLGRPPRLWRTLFLSTAAGVCRGRRGAAAHSGTSCAGKGKLHPVGTDSALSITRRRASGLSASAAIHCLLACTQATSRRRARAPGPPAQAVAVWVHLEVVEAIVAAQRAPRIFCRWCERGNQVSDRFCRAGGAAAVARRSPPAAVCQMTEKMAQLADSLTIQ